MSAPSMNDLRPMLQAMGINFVPKDVLRREQLLEQLFKEWEESEARIKKIESGLLFDPDR